MINRRRLLAGAGFAATTLAAPAVLRAQPKTVKMGALRLIHSIRPYFYEKFAPAGFKVEVIPFESPTDGKNAVLTGTVDTCIYGIAAAILGAAAGEPVVIVGAMPTTRHGGHGRRNTDIKTVKDLKGKKVAIWPGSTQEVVILERLRMEGMTIKDIQPIRLPFSDMHGGARARRRRRLCRRRAGARHQPRQRHRPARRVSLLDADRPAQHDPSARSEKTVKENPERCKLIVDMHRKAVDYMPWPTSRRSSTMAVQKLGQQRRSIELAVPTRRTTSGSSTTRSWQAPRPTPS